MRIARERRGHVACGLSAAALMVAVLLGARTAAAQQGSGGLADVDVSELARLTPGLIEHCAAQIAARDFGDIFECGDELFDTDFNAVDGVGGDVGNGQRFTRVPRYDLPGYAIGPVPRDGGPDAQSCAACHLGAPIGGGGDGAGQNQHNIITDKLGPAGGGNPAGFVVRNPPHLFAPGALQVLAEEMTFELGQRRAAAVREACSGGAPVEVALSAKRVDFGTLRVSPGTGDCAANAGIDTSGVRGVDRDLVVRPFGLEGLTASLRTFVLVAFHNELGMEPVELSGVDSDNDRDGVVNEVWVEDATAMTVYLAAQPIPLTELQLDRLRRNLQDSAEGRAALQRLPALPVLSAADREQIARGEDAFREIGCARCHVPEFRLERRRFREPSSLPAFRPPGDRSPAGLDRIAAGVDPAHPQSFDLVLDPPDNRVEIGDQVLRLGGLETDANGDPVIRAFSDLRRHDMGQETAERISRPSESGQMLPGSVFITAELWGVGSTAPYLHDGSATTLPEAIVRGHGGEADPERRAFRALPLERQADLIRFLDNLVLAFLNPPEAED